MNTQNNKQEQNSLIALFAALKTIGWVDYLWGFCYTRASFVFESQKIGKEGRCTSFTFFIVQMLVGNRLALNSKTTFLR